MTFKILITDNLSEQGLAQLQAAPDVTYDVVTGLSVKELVQRIPGYHGLIVRSSVKVTKEVLEAADQLKVVGRAGVGLDNVDIDAASVQGIIVLNTPGANTIATAEHTIAMLLASSRNIPQADKSIRDNQWARKKFMGVQLHKKTLGVVGLGRVGAQVAKRAASFGMNILAFDPYISDEVARELTVTLVELDELLAQADFITLHGALTNETRNLINAKAIAKMKRGVRLINCSRGELVDEADLVDALKSGHIAAAALDVFAGEPLSDSSELRCLPNVVLTPHIAASTVEAQRDVSTQVVSRVLAALRSEDFRTAVNMPVANPNIFKELRPYLNLAERLGALQMQLAEGRIKRVEVEVQGSEVANHVKPLVVALLKGMLDTITDVPVNYVNAPHLAMRRGITVTETKGLPTLSYANLLLCRVVWDGDSRLVIGSLLGRELPRVVQIDDFKLDAQPNGIILVMESLDQPGTVGQIATLLGQHRINIAEWRMGRTHSDGAQPPHNLSFINLDAPAPAEVLAQLATWERVLSVRQITL